MARHLRGSPPAGISLSRLARFLAVGMLGGGILVAIFLWFRQLLGDAHFAAMPIPILPVVIASRLTTIADRQRR